MACKSETEAVDQEQREYEAYLALVDTLEDEIGTACDDQPIGVVMGALVRHVALALHNLDAEDRIEAKYDFFRDVEIELQAIIVGSCDA